MDLINAHKMEHVKTVYRSSSTRFWKLCSDLMVSMQLGLLRRASPSHRTMKDTS